jgi:hypothetical protein
MKFIIYNPETKLFDFFINSLIKEFEILKIDVVNYFDKNLIIDFSIDIIMIIIDPHFIFDYKHIEEEVAKISKNYKYKILYITEPINFLIEKTIYTNLIKKINPYCLWTYTFENLNKLKIPQKIFKIFPPNNFFKFIEVKLDNLKERNINNIIFFGNITENRIKICSEFNHYLINKTSAWSIEEWKNILLNNLFYLNIHRRNNCKSFETFRIVPILANGGVIFSERCNEIEEELYKKYNIFFIDKTNIYNFFLEFIKNINYEDIYNKYISFLEDTKSNLNSYLNYHQLCANTHL